MSNTESKENLDEIIERCKRQSDLISNIQKLIADEINISTDHEDMVFYVNLIHIINDYSICRIFTSDDPEFTIMDAFIDRITSVHEGYKEYKAERDAEDE